MTFAMSAARALERASTGCALEGYGGIECGGRMHLHHAFNYSKARGNRRARKVLKGCPVELTWFVCESHNVGRWADGKAAQAILFRRAVDTYGRERVEAALASLVGKVAWPEFRLEALLDGA